LRGLPSESTSRQNRGIPLVNGEPDALIYPYAISPDFPSPGTRLRPLPVSPQSVIDLKLDAENPWGKTRDA